MLFYDSSCSPSVRPSFTDILNRVMQQVEYPCFANPRTGYIDPLYKELCLILSEVFLMRSETVIKVNGSDLPIQLVQDVFVHLRNDHLRMVYANFYEVPNRVYNKKSYLRTALYNAFFELESHFINDGHCN